jgi:hypothetical protein
MTRKEEIKATGTRKELHALNEYYRSEKQRLTNFLARESLEIHRNYGVGPNEVAAALAYVKQHRA